MYKGGNRKIEASLVFGSAYTHVAISFSNSSSPHSSRVLSFVFPNKPGVFPFVPHFQNFGVARQN